jgi:hypothetical protein
LEELRKGLEEDRGFFLAGSNKGFSAECRLDDAGDIRGEAALIAGLIRAWHQRGRMTFSATHPLVILFEVDTLLPAVAGGRLTR